MAEYQILYWHDIPLQVRAGARDERVSQELPSRFQVAADNAAMAVGLIDTDEYLNELAWGDPQEREGDPQAVVSAVVAELTEKHKKIDWHQTVASISARIAEQSSIGE